MPAARNIVLGVTGGIAAYKAAELTRELCKQGANVKVMMTKNAAEFVTPLTFRTLSGHPVYMDMFSPVENNEIEHISLATWAELIIIAPATANILGKVASGVADDLLTTTVMAAKAPVLFVPAMNEGMWHSPIVKDNVRKLKKAKYRVLEPDRGELACKTEGQGRMPPVGVIADEVETILSKKDLTGENILITAGPTREAFDPVRFITNHSSGKMGYALAIMASRRGAKVTLISGPTSLETPRGITCIPVVNAREMRDAVFSHLPPATVIIKAAAVADYHPVHYADAKIKKGALTLRVTLKQNPDIIAEIAEVKGHRILVGFAMETERLIENAKQKLLKKKMDLIVANNLKEKGAGFQADTNVVKILKPDGTIEHLPKMDKLAVADIVLDRIKDLILKKDV